jgi:crotonobetainyl-CoA:carnitine CoA-transferase CaiB-like acyl-CoA transferase
MPGPLAGIWVVDMGHAGVGPYAGSIMGQLGAEVIKVEPPWGDIIQQSGSAGKQGMSTFYIALNVNKRGIVLDLRAAADRDIFYKIIERSDVYMDNWRDGAADRLGIGYDDLARVNPRLVYVNSSGFGARGPLRAMGSYDGYGELFSGITSFTGAPDTRGEKARGGVRIDTQTTLCLVEMILAALWYRQRTGRGQKVQGSQMESALQLASVRAIETLNFGGQPRPMGSGHPHLVPSRAFRASDAYVAVTAHNEQEWRNFCVALGRPDLVFDPRFADNARRVEHREALEAILEPLFGARTAAELVDAFQARRVPAGPFLTHAEQLEDPHIMGTGMLARVASHWGEMVVPPFPVRFSQTPTHIVPGPRPGQDTVAVLAEYGYGPEQARPWVGPAERFASAGDRRGA